MNLPVGQIALSFARLGLEHIAEINRLELECFSYPWPRYAIETSCRDRRYRMFGSFSDHQLCAYAIVLIVEEEAELHKIGVSPKYRQRGIARQLLQFAFQRLADEGAKQLHLEVRSGNIAAQKLYAACGMWRSGLRRAYYSDTGEDAILYSLMLSCLTPPLREGS